MLVVLNLLKERCQDDTKVLAATEIQILWQKGRKLSSNTEVKQTLFHVCSIKDSNLFQSLTPFHRFSVTFNFSPC